MKRIPYILVALMLMGGYLIQPVKTQAAIPIDPCSSLSVEQPSSPECDSAVDANPLPELERPTKYNPAKDGRSRPRAILLPETMPKYPIGWVLKEWYYSTKPGEDLVVSKERFYDRGQLVMIYASVRVRNFEWLMIGKGRWIPGDYIAVLKMPERPAEVSGRWITLDLSEQTLIASIDDKHVFATLISTGWSQGYGVTHEGVYHIYARTYSTVFKGPPWAKIPEYIFDNVPTVMFFNGNEALHGAYWHNYFGFERSHGCVNIPVADAQWLWDWVSQTADQWGPDTGSFFLKNPNKAPFVYVYKSAKKKKA